MRSSVDILLLRHGESEGNQTGRFGGHGPTPLTELGRRQAQATARALAAEGGLTTIYASDLVRAVDTARPICEATGIAMQTSPALRERSVGVFTGLTFSECEARWPEAYRALVERRPDCAPPEGETHLACTARMVAFFEEALARTSSGRVLFVSHGAALGLLLYHLIGVPHATHGRRIAWRTDNCALHRLRRNPDGLYTVVALNDRAHLRDL